MSCDSQCSVTFPCDAVGWSVVCNCGFPDHIRLLLCLKNALVQMPKAGFLTSNDYMLVSIIHVNFRFKGPLVSCFMNKQLAFTLYVKV